jgi:hypothetical protein
MNPSMDHTLNEVYSTRSMKRRYEVWFLRLGLADGSGAWWFRYLLMNLGRGGCSAATEGRPVQVWATWFSQSSAPQHWIQGFGMEDLNLSPRGRSPFQFSVPGNSIDEQSCRGELRVGGHEIGWDLHYSSNFRATLSNKGWIGFSRTPHSDAKFSGEIHLDGRSFRGNPLGWGVQGHNCGFRHRNFWTWTHAVFPHADGSLSSLEALVYEMPLGLVFRKALLWHLGEAMEFKSFRDEARDRGAMRWQFRARSGNGAQIDVSLDGTGPSVHRLPYMKTDCSGTFEVANNSLANARVALRRAAQPETVLETRGGAVLEMVGDP